MKSCSLFCLAPLVLLACYEAPEQGVLVSGPLAGPTKPAELSLRITRADLPKAQTRISFGVAPFVGRARARQSFEPFAAHLSKVLGVQVDLVVGRSYQDLIDKVVADKLDVVILPPASYVLAKRRSPNLQLLASQIAYGATSYSSYILVRADDPARKLSDLAGRRIAFVDRHSTSGYLFPYAAFLNVGLDPNADFSEILYPGEHIQTIRHLLAGDVDAAATASGMLNVSRATSPSLDTGGTRILFNAGRIPYDALCASGRLPSSGAKKIAWAFIGLSTRTAIGRRLFAQTNAMSGWIPAVDSLYDGVRDVLTRVQRHQAERGGPR